MKTIAEEDFEPEVLKKKQPVLVLFTNEWNGSVLIVKSSLLQLEKKFKGLIQFIELPQGNDDEIMKAYGIIQIPSILIFSHGNVVEKLDGIHSKNRINAILDKIK